MREHDVGAFHRATPIVHIGHKDPRPRRPRGLGLGGGRVPRAAPLDRDVRAVHVHLAVANLVEPRPGKEGVTRGRIGGQGEAPFRGERAAADKGADDGEGGAGVVGQRDLARAAVVGGAALKRDAVGLAGGPVGHGPALVGVEEAVVALARVPGARVREGAVHVVVDAGGVGVVLGPEGRRGRHLHVGGGEAREGEDEAELHLETWCFCFLYVEVVSTCPWEVRLVKSLMVFGIWVREKGGKIVGYILFFFVLDMARGRLCLQRNWRGATPRIPNWCNMSKHGSPSLI